MMSFRFPLPPLGAATIALMLAGCSPSIPVPRPIAPLPPAPQAIPSAPVVLDWRDMPLTPGTWRYVPGDSVSSARYGRNDMAPDLIVRCDRAKHQVALLRGGLAQELSLTTSAGVERRVAGRIDDGSVPMTGILFSAWDPLLDRMIFSRGRFAITAPGLPALAVPAWAEPARAIEDCRK